MELRCQRHPSEDYFTNGNVTKYRYSTTGQKLSVEYYVAAPNVTVTFGTEPDALTQSQTMYAGSRQYLLGGSLVMEDGMIDKYLFGGGYASASMTNPTTYNFSFYYYNQDHLGNNREVVDSAGTVRQITHYYPFGTPYADPSTILNASLQPYKYNGKELDRMHGLDTYDYGARQYNPVTARWDRMDPLCEKYYNISPYAYCGGNPVNRIDPDGREIWIYYDDENGEQQSFQYSVGMDCPVSNSSAEAFVNNLNTMHKNDSGATVIDAIMNSPTKYGYVQSNTLSDDADGYFDSATNISNINDVNDTHTFAEETFHMYQYVNNQGGKTDVNEVEAKLFSAKMYYEIDTWFNKAPYKDNLAGLPESPYSNSMTILFFEGYNDADYKVAVNNFFSGSLCGKNYRNKPGYKPGSIKENPLIKGFLPVNF